MQPLTPSIAHAHVVQLKESEGLAVETSTYVTLFKARVMKAAYMRLGVEGVCVCVYFPCLINWKAVFAIDFEKCVCVCLREMECSFNVLI